MSDLDHIPSDDPPGADSSPMSELQRNAMAPIPRQVRAAHLITPFPKLTTTPEVRWYSGDDDQIAIIDFGDHQIHLHSKDQAADLVAAFLRAMSLFDEHEPLTLADHTASAVEKIMGA